MSPTGTPPRSESEIGRRTGDAREGADPLRATGRSESTVKVAAAFVQSYTRERERRCLLLTAAFGIFLAQGLWLLIEMATMAVSSVGSGWLALNLAVLISLYLALLR